MAEKSKKEMTFELSAEGTRAQGLVVGCVGYGLFLSWMWIIYFSNFAVSYAGMDADHALQLRIIMLAALGIALPILGACERFFVSRRGIAVSALASVFLCPLASVAALLFPCECTSQCAYSCQCAAMLAQGVAWAFSGIGYAFLMIYWVWFLVALGKMPNHSLVIASTMVVSSAVFFSATLLLPSVSVAVHALLPALSVICSMFSHRRLATVTVGIAIKKAVPERDFDVASGRLSKKTLTMTWFSGVALGFCGHTVTTGFYIAWADMVLSALFVVASVAMFFAVRCHGGYRYGDLLWLYVPVATFCLIPMCLVSGMGRALFACILIAALTAYSFADLDMLVKDMSSAASHITKVMAFGRIGNVLGLAVGWLVAGFAFRMESLRPDAFVVACLGLVLVLVAASTYMFRGLGFLSAPTVVARTADDRYERQCFLFAKKYGLTERQLDVLRLLGRGRTALTIQDKLFISESTAKTHIYNIYQKVGIHTQRELMELLDAVNPNVDETLF